MKKRVTNAEIGEFIGELAEEIRCDMNSDFDYAKCQMNIAEDELVKSLDQKQKALYDDFCEKRKAFFDIASQIYKRKF